MKKITAILSLFVIVVMMACTPKSNAPEKVAEDFIKAVYTADFVKAKSLCTEESKQVIDLIATLTSEMTSEMKKAKVAYEVAEVIIADDGNSATVYGFVKNSLDMEKGTPIDSKEEKIKLIKVDDQWLVDYKLK